MPEPIVLLLSTSDTDLITARSSGANYRWANPSRLDPAELPELLDGVDVVVVRILGGYRSWQDGIDAVISSSVPTVLVSGEQAADAELTDRSTVPAGIAVQTHLYLAHGGVDNLRHLHAFLTDAGLLAELGGQVMPHGLWYAMAGMESEKQVTERRIVLPLSEPDVAAQYGVSPPKAVILFGPPGTGKTSFAKAVSGRLGWPFVELFPSRLATPGVSMATALREAFTSLMELESVVLFIDEVEEIAGVRSGDPSDPAHGVTNELLKLIPAFR